MSTAVPLRSRGAVVPLPQESPWTLPVLGRPALAFAVYGNPVTQGSHGVKGKKRVHLKAGGTKLVPNVIDSSDEKGLLTAWREAVAAAAIARLPAGWEVLDCPIVADLIVSVSRTKRTPKTLRTVPATKPDLSKLARASEDGIGTTAPRGFKVGRSSVYVGGRQIIADDSRIVSYRRLDKVWVDDPLDTDSLPAPGAVIRLWRYPEALLGKIERTP